MRKLKKALSLSLALVLSLALAVPAFATGTTETFADENHGITFTVNNVVKKETGTYAFDNGGDLETKQITIYIVSGDKITGDIKANPGFSYFDYNVDEWDDNAKYAVMGYGYYYWTSTGTIAGGMGTSGEFGGPYTWEFSSGYDFGDDSDERPWLLEFNGSYLMLESEFAAIAASPGQPTTPTTPEQPSTPTTPEQPTEPTTPTEPEQPSTPTTPTTPSTPAAPGSYTAKKGDTWSSICTNYYGTNAQRYALMKANKGVTLKEGAVITLPEKLGKDTLIPAPVVAAGEKLYTVKAGDILGKIAAAEYGKVSEYKAIFERNADRLKNANTIYEGQVIVLPVKK